MPHEERMNSLPIIQPNPSDDFKREYFDAAERSSLERDLQAKISGEVRFSAGDRALYATDGSNYRQIPIGVVIPRTKEDVIAAIEIARRHGAPLLSRGGGTSLAGQCCNAAVVLDFSKYMNRVLEIDPEGKWARVQPGCILDDLRNAANKYQLTFGPDPSTHDHCTLGGMLGNNSCGVHSQMAGRTVDNTEELEVVLYDGTRMTLGWMTEADLEQRIAEGGRIGQIHAQLKALRDRYATLVRERYPQIPRRVSGYNLDELIPGQDGRFNLARAVVGSESTCLTILEAKVRLVYWPPVRTLVVLGYKDIYHAADHVPEVNEAKPIGLEAIDEYLVRNMTRKHLQVDSLKLLPPGEGWLLVQFGGETKEEADDKARRMMDVLRAKSDAPTMKLYDDPHEEKEVWIARESGLGATAFVPGEPLTWEGWEDSAVAPEKLGGYLRDLCALYKKHGYRGSLYGHFGQGCVHTRIDFDLESKAGVRNFRAFLDDATTLVTNYGGSISGEHGDGQSKAEFLVKMFGPELISAFEQFKSIWDPDWKMNPGKIVRPYKVDENLRLGPEYAPWKPQTHFHYPDDGGEFAHAAMRCVGVGKCRRTSANDETMCPSFMVTREEKHTTRGRAHMLWEMTRNGSTITDGWKSEEVKEALDLCLSCKGCKGDCPVNVDVATMKSEFLSHYYEGRMRPRHAYAFGYVDKSARLASLWPGLANLFTQTPGLRSLAKLLVGIPQQRSIPAFATETFQSGFKKRETSERFWKQRVVLWPDTFNNYFYPETAMAAANVLEAAQCKVEVPKGHVCCGRPLYDFGMLGEAKVYLRSVLRKLQPHLRRGDAIVVLEPSCASVFRDEAINLLPDDPWANALSRQTFLLSEFLEKKAPYFSPPRLDAPVLLHGHCHHKSVMKMKDERTLLQRMGAQMKEPESGCCGMAGSFGYEKDKYAVSLKVGERVLLPAVREATNSTIILTDGFSCRSQIEQQTDRHALHLADVMQMAMAGTSSIHQTPEMDLVRTRKSKDRRSRFIAAFGLAATAGAMFMLLRDRKRPTVAHA
jgi:FAD/FMN-containing dehydrogenase/Fe-S oxidoreductase